MSSNDTRESGAETPHESSDPCLQDAVAGLLKLSLEEKDYLNSYSASTVESKIIELVEFINQPTGKPQRTVPDVLGQLVLLYDRKAQLQAAEHQAQLQAAERGNSNLQREVRDYRFEVSRTQEDRARLLEETDAAYAQLQAATQEAEARVKEAQARQVSTAANLFSLESPDSDTENVSAVNPSSQTLGWTPSNPITRDGHRAQVAARPMDTGSLPSRSVPQSIQSRATLRFDLSPPLFRTGVSYSREASGFRSSYADDRSTSRSSRPNPNRTPPPARRRSHRPSRFGDPSDYGSSDDSDRGYPPRSHGLRTHQLESLAKDIERFDPSSRESNIDDYLREIERCLLDLPHASSREELKLVWKTTARSVHVFMESLAPQIRDRYSALCNALREEYSPYTDPASATLGAFAVMHKKHESPRDYYRRLRAAYFQGRSAPGLEEEQTFKSLFLHNLHESVRYDVTMSSRSNNLSMHEIRRYAQMAWETQTRPVKWQEDDAARVLGIQSSESNDLALEGNEMPRAWENARVTYQGRQPPRQYGSQPPLQHGNQQNQGGGNQGYFHNHARPWQPDTFQPKRFQYDQNPKQRGKYNDAVPNPPRGEGWQEMENMIRKCFKEAMRQFGTASQQPALPDTPKKSDDSPPPV